LETHSANSGRTDSTRGRFRADDPPRPEPDPTAPPDEAPETPPDEPRPPRVQDPPPEPARKGPYVVRAASAAGRGVRRPPGLEGGK